ncbi:MAG: DegT/DnrJ/EryC1/StrS family aminotransferase, partial [Nitrospirota bacterium]
AALGSTQMSKLARIVAARRRAAARYDILLDRTSLQKPSVTPGAGHVYQSYVTLMPVEAAPRRAQIMKEAKDAGVETQVGTIHMPLATYYRNKYGHKAGDFPVTDAVAARALTLPLYETITSEEQQFVASVILGLLG